MFKTYHLHVFAEQETLEQRFSAVTDVFFNTGQLIIWLVDRRIVMNNVNRFEVIEE